MRTLTLGRSLFTMAAIAAAVAFAGLTPALASPGESQVATPEPTLSADLQDSLTETYGEEEGAYLKRETLRLVQEALVARGAEPVADGGTLTIEITIVRAMPNRPTMTQLRDTPGLSMESISIGGAEFEAVIRDAGGVERARVTHERFSFDIEDSLAAGVWTDARRAMRGFAHKVADAYAGLS